jgi:hypothetical protein
MGIWPPDSDGTDINSLDRSPQGDLLLTADDSGKVRVDCCSGSSWFCAITAVLPAVGVDVRATEIHLTLGMHDLQRDVLVLAWLQHAGSVLDTSSQGDLLLTADDSGKVRGGVTCLVAAAGYALPRGSCRW